MNNPAETRFYVTGMKCNGCIANAKKALAGVPGYDDIDVNLAEGTAVVKGDVDPQAVIQALGGVGYAAVVKSA